MLFPSLYGAGHRSVLLYATKGTTHNWSVSAKEILFHSCRLKKLVGYFFSRYVELCGITIQCNQKLS